MGIEAKFFKVEVDPDSIESISYSVKVTREETIFPQIHIPENIGEKLVKDPHCRREWSHDWSKSDDELITKQASLVLKENGNEGGEAWIAFVRVDILSNGTRPSFEVRSGRTPIDALSKIQDLATRYHLTEEYRDHNGSF